MQWQEPYADLARDRQQQMLDDAEMRRLTRRAVAGAAPYREWLARQLVVLALCLAPSVRVSLRGLLLDEATPPLSPRSGRSLKPLT